MDIAEKGRIKGHTFYEAENPPATVILKASSKGPFVRNMLAAHSERDFSLTRKNSVCRRPYLWMYACVAWTETAGFLA